MLNLCNYYMINIIFVHLILRITSQCRYCHCVYLITRDPRQGRLLTIPFFQCQLISLQTTPNFLFIFNIRHFSTWIPKSPKLIFLRAPKYFVTFSKSKSLSGIEPDSNPGSPALDFLLIITKFYSKSHEHSTVGNTI